MRNVCLLWAGVLASSYALVTAYHVDPRTAAMSGKASGDPQTGGVSQILTINFDEPITASLFCGAVGDSGRYHVSVRTYPGDVEIASGDTNSPRDHSWATCTLLVSRPDSFIKGRRIEFRWTRSGSDSIHYYYDTACGYDYGQMIAPYQYGLLTAAPMLVQAV